MENQFPLNRTSDLCPYCSGASTEFTPSEDEGLRAGERRTPDPEQRNERSRETGLPDFLAELRRNFTFEASFEPVWAEAVAP